MIIDFYSYLIIIGTGMLGIWKAIPVGIILKISPVFIFLMTTFGATCSVLILYFFGSRINHFFDERRKNNRRSKKQLRVSKLLDKYGVAGLGFLGSLLFGPNMTIIVGLIVVKSRKKLLYWTLAGVIVWTLVLTVMAFYSVELFNKLLGIFS